MAANRRRTAGRVLHVHEGEMKSLFVCLIPLASLLATAGAGDSVWHGSKSTALSNLRKASDQTTKGVRV